MATPTAPKEIKKTLLETQGALATKGSFVSQSYYELPNRSSDVTDVLQQLNANIDKLSDLQGRVHFLLGEIRGLATKM